MHSEHSSNNDPKDVNMFREYSVKCGALCVILDSWLIGACLFTFRSFSSQTVTHSLSLVFTPNCNNVVIGKKRQKAKKPNRNKLAM